MKTLEEFGLRIPEILLPKNTDTKTWSVIACDQYTQDKDYWKKAEKNAEGKNSTLNLILPEIYLNDDRKNRIEKIRLSMESYLKNDVFEKEKKSLVYVERKTSFGRTRKGIVVAIDLETYEWKPFSKANIRATEATITSRIPPRMEIRKGALLELPHIMLLANDKNNVLIEKIGKMVQKKSPLYSGKLMNNGGEISGWEVKTEEEISEFTKNLNELAKSNTSKDGSVFLFAVGDGNHSLATAKAVWDEYKNELKSKGASDLEIQENPVRFALVEIVNIYDSGLTFEPIHRVIFNIDAHSFMNFLAKKFDGKIIEKNSATELESDVKNSSADFGFTFLENKNQKYFLLSTKIKELAVSRFQPETDEFLKNVADSEIDYIHGNSEIFRLGAKENTVGILLPPISKDSFFETINNLGPLPRKSFSMGEADEKRFYLEARKLFS